jgi:hypothetical protein
MNQDLGVAPGFEHMPPGLEIFPYGQVIVDLAVKDNRNGLILIHHGLVSSGDIDDGKASDSDADVPVEIKPFIVRSPVVNHTGHIFQDSAVDRPLRITIHNAADTAHVVTLLSPSCFLVCRIEKLCSQ